MNNLPSIPPSAATPSPAGRTIGPRTRAVVVGAGASGAAACRLLRELGASVRLVDRRAETMDPDFARWAASADVAVLGGEHTPEQFADADCIVLSPGVPVSAVLRVVPDAVIGPDGKGGPHPELLAETELAWRYLDGEPVVGITGTSGKTTTATLCAAMFREQGLDVFLGGNIGTPLSRYVLDVGGGARGRADALVLELSSFQLQACSSLRPRVAVLTGLSPNHLDHHADMKEYTEAKMRLFRCQTEADLAVLAGGLETLAEEHGLRARRAFVRDEGEDAPDFAGLRLIGPHNRRNALTAWLACRELGVSREAAGRAAAGLEPIPNRLEAVAERHGVVYVNDSKCTTVEALRVALEAFDRPVLLLAGGKFKGGDLEGLRPLLQVRVKAVALFGGSRDLFERAWDGAVPLEYRDTLEAAVRRLEELAGPGDVILLAPATSSFDQYANYEERGADFRRIAREAR